MFPNNMDIVVILFHFFCWDIVAFHAITKLLGMIFLAIKMTMSSLPIQLLAILRLSI